MNPWTGRAARMGAIVAAVEGASAEADGRCGTAEAVRRYFFDELLTLAQTAYDGLGEEARRKVTDIAMA